MCGIWDWQSTIVKDLNDSQDPKNTLLCRENAFVAIYALFSDNKCPLFKYKKYIVVYIALCFSDTPPYSRKERAYYS